MLLQVGGSWVCRRGLSECRRCDCTLIVIIPFHYFSLAFPASMMDDDAEASDGGDDSTATVTI